MTVCCSPEMCSIALSHSFGLYLLQLSPRRYFNVHVNVFIYLYLNMGKTRLNALNNRNTCIYMKHTWLHIDMNVH